MTKRKPAELKSRRRPSEAARAESNAQKADASWFSSAAMRETIESVIIAFVLAFLFRTFEAEAFVIPTGSMAPTLMGKHKDLECPMCHYRYQVSASDHQNRDHSGSEVASKVYHATCPMCRFTADLKANNPQKKSYPTYDGDRILVAKFPYEFADPKRWDVIVFKYPNDATMNYIKRLVGLPGETIRIHDGNLWIHEPDQPEGHFEIARKPPEKVLAMLQPVYDNDLAPTITGTLHWPPRWTPDKLRPGDNSWTPSKDLSSFEIDGGVKGPAWIRYRHRVPTPEQWERNSALANKAGSSEEVLPQLISDFTAYNTAFGDQSDRSSEPLIERGFSQHWVGDLAVQFDLESTSASGKVVAELIKGGRQFQCHFDLATGKAELKILGGGPEADGYHRTATTAIVGPGRHSIIFANIDDELNLWVGPPHDAWFGHPQVVAFKDPKDHDALPPQSERHPNQYDSDALHDRIPTEADLSPVGISAEGASVKVSHVKVLRDVYYIAAFLKGGNQDSRNPNPNRLLDFIYSQPDLTNPRNWQEDFKRGNMREVEIELKPADRGHPERDCFFVLGDNSAQSSDGRLWIGEWSVERELLIGKALFIYWPHGWEIPYLPLPFNPVPYFQRMHLVR